MGYAKEWLTTEEWQQLRDAPHDREYVRGDEQFLEWRDELLLRLTYRGGLRISEALDLQYPYNFEMEKEEGYVKIYGSKTDDGQRDVSLQPIGRDLITEVRRFMNTYGEEVGTNYVLVSEQGTALSRQRAYQIINELADVAGIDKKLGTHTLRRSRAKHLLDENMELEEVQRFLRHDRITTTMDYLRIAKKKIAEKAREVDEEHGL